jgi:hypothetical protein
VDEARIPVAYDRLEDALSRIVKKYEFENFVMTIKSAGYIEPSMIGSMNAMNFAYALYLRLRQEPGIGEGERKRVVKRWFVMSMLTGRNSGSFESTWEQDMRRMAGVGPVQYLKQIEEAELSDAFWGVQLPANLETSSVRSPYFQAFVAAQVTRGARGFLSKGITVQAMHEQSGDIHHVVPKDYLRKNGFPDRSDYNQVANFAVTETSINIRIGNRPPAQYLSEIDAQINGGPLTLGELADPEDLRRNLEENALPAALADVTSATYPSYLKDRRARMAGYIRTWYEAL